MGPQGLAIQLLGEPMLRWDGRVEPLPRSKKARALLGFLVTTGRPHRRERLADLFWDTPDDPRAQLRWTLWKLKPLLQRGRRGHLVADRDQVAFDPAGADIDLHRVRSLLAGGVEHVGREALEAAATQFRGELLEGLDLPDCLRYREWCLAEREVMRRLHVRVLSALVAQLTTEPDLALPHARAWVAVDPLREEGHVAVVRLLGQLGRTREALAQYDACRRLLETELDSRPSLQLEQARAALSRKPAAPAAETTAASTRAPVPDSRSIIPLVGRRDECALWDGLVGEAAEGRAGRAVLIVGEPGIGKTRLLAELGDRVCRTGGLLLQGRAFEAEQARPYGIWIEALRPLLAGDVPQSLRARLAPLLPVDPGGQGAPLNREGLFEAVGQLLSSAAVKVPVAVVLDDIQWIDEVSAALLHFIARGLGSQRVLLACAARAGELGDNAACLRAVRALARERRLQQVALGPLDEPNTAELVRSVGAGLDVDRVWKESEGNPLFALEVARALSRGGGPLSDSLEQLIDDRLLLLDDRAREVLPWIAVLGRQVSPDRLAEITQIPLPHLLGIIDAMARVGILRAVGEPDGYDFSHDLVRQVAYKRIPPPRRRLLHVRIARSLVPLVDQDEALAVAVARHAAEGGDHELCAQVCVRAGRHCLRVFAFGEAENLADLGRRHLSTLPRDERIRLHIALLGILVHPGVRMYRPAGLGTEIATVCGEAQAAGLIAELSQGLHLLGWIHQLRWGDFPRAQAHALQVLELVRKLPAPQNLEALISSARCLAVLEVHMPEAKAMFQELAAYGPAAVDNRYFQWGLGLVQRWEGNWTGARAALTKGAALALDKGDAWAQFECESGLAAMELEAGNFGEVKQLCQQLGSLAAKLGEGGTEGPLVEALAALAAAAAAEPGSEAAVDTAVRQLTGLDAQYLLAYVLNAAAEIECLHGRWDRAASRAEAALGAARSSGRRPQVARAHALLARAAAARGDEEQTRRQLEELERSGAEQLSAPSRAALGSLVASSRSLRGGD